MVSGDRQRAGYVLGEGLQQVGKIDSLPTSAEISSSHVHDAKNPIFSLGDQPMTGRAKGAISRSNTRTNHRVTLQITLVLL